MSDEPKPVTSLDDPRAITLLTTEHWSLLSARTLAYNEALTRGSMFLTFLSMSFVALALLSQTMAFGDEFLIVTAVVLAFDLVIGLTTYGRINGANVDDLRAVHGMARIRHGYVEIAPLLDRYFTTPTHDDVASLMSVYGTPGPKSRIGDLLYGFTTSGGMIGLINSLVGGVLVAVAAILFGVSGEWALWIGVAGGIALLGIIVVSTFGRVAHDRAGLESVFPASDGS